MHEIEIPMSRQRHLMKYLGLTQYQVKEILLYPDEGLATIIKQDSHGVPLYDANGNPEQEYIRIKFVDTPDPMFMARGNNGPLR